MDMMTTGEAAADRRVVGVTGADAPAFLQGLMTNDLSSLDRALGLVWTAMLTPQGKYLADFFVGRMDGLLVLDLHEAIAEATLKRLAMYRLRADVQLTQSALLVRRGIGETPADALSDPRHPALGWRAYGTTRGADPTIDWDAIRVAHVIPETGIELTPDTYVLEAGFERLHGVDFRKGCYVGQEVTARMKHKTDLKKGLVQVRVEGSAPPGTEIATEGRPAGTLYTQANGLGIAYLRFDRAEGPMQAGDATLWRV